MSEQSLDELASEVIDMVTYLVLGTVYPDGYWVSHPLTHHSANIERDARARATILDTTAPVGAGRAVHLSLGTGRDRRVGVHPHLRE